MNRRLLPAAMLAALAVGGGPAAEPRPQRSRRPTSRSRGGPYNRDQERERRRGQIERGQLRPNCRDQS